MSIRIKGKYKRAPGVRPVNIFLPDDMIKQLKQKYDADSNQALFFALALDALGDVNLKKDKEVNIEDFLDKYL